MGHTGNHSSRPNPRPYATSVHYNDVRLVRGELAGCRENLLGIG